MNHGRLLGGTISRLLFYSISFGVLLILSHPLWLPIVILCLDVSKTPRIVNTIVVLGGGSGRRSTYASELYHKGYAQTIIVSGYVGYMERDIRILQQQQIPNNNVIINDRATNTFNEAQQVIEILIHNNLQSALIVTDKFHSRRALATYRHIAHEQSIELTVVSPDDNIDPSSWWKPVLKSSIVQEIIKIPYYWIAYGVWSF